MSFYRKIIYLLLPIIYMNLIYTQDCQPDFILINNSCYYEDDINVLNDFITLNKSLNNHDVLDVGVQSWLDGRLISLNLEDFFDLEENKLTTIPESIGNLIYLEFLTFYSNLITTVPYSIGNLIHLEWLLLNDNLISSIPESIGLLQNLEVLWLDDNMLFSLPENICNLPTDCHIKAYNNMICYNQFDYHCVDGMNEQQCISCMDGYIPDCSGNGDCILADWLGDGLCSAGSYNDGTPEGLEDLSCYQCDGGDCFYENVDCQDLNPLIGSECMLSDGQAGFYDCELCCWDVSLFNWLGDNWCDQTGGCSWEGPQYNCPELGYDCGDCNDIWFHLDSSSVCINCSSLLGDLNNDIYINIFDIIIMINCIIYSECSYCEDINNDSFINVLDVIQLVNYILGN